MESQLYLYPSLRKKFKRPIESFRDIFNERVFTIFENIESEADEVANKYYEDIMSDFDEIIDPLSVSEDAIEYGLNHYLSLNLVRYNIIAFSIVALYQIWEQSVRLFLYREIEHTEKINISSFCTNISKIILKFSEYNVNIKEMQCWDAIDELRLLCNAIKHGDGESAKELLKKNPPLFKKSLSGKPALEYNITTLLEETLDLSPDLLTYYSKSLLDFWDKLPERSYIKKQEDLVK